jgi:deferrochelatase/peroxidase EfeB
MSNGVDLDQDPQNFIKPEDLPEIQGVILRGYKLGFVRHFVLQILQPAAFKQFLGKLVPGQAGSGPLTVTSSAPWPDRNQRPEYYLNLGFSYSGLMAAGLPSDAISFGNPFQFEAFKTGAVARASQVGDVGANAPENWVDCLNPTNSPRAHVVISLYAGTPEKLDSFSATLREMFTAGGAAQALPFSGGTNGAPAVDHFDGQALPDDLIHFGYKDGISQPHVMGMHERQPDQQPKVPAWEVVLRKAATSSKPTYTLPEPSILTRNGGFAAFRILEQDVEGFDKYSTSQPGIDPELLVAKFCGRWRNGNPLALCPHAAGDPLPASQLGNFNYDDDPNGDKTPIGSHTRRGNPRSSESVPTNPPAHRIVRRAMPYGPVHEQGDTTPRGLVGYFIGSSLEQQFEFIMRVWINGKNFSSNFTLPQGTDPVLGTSDPQSASFSFPPSGQVSGFEQFITTKGGMYCFLPSIPALQWMSQQP